jgi:hypothetical protein
MFCAKTVQETKETNKACSVFLKHVGRLSWQELEKQKETQEQKKRDKQNFWIAITALAISVVLAVKEILTLLPH